MKKRVIALSATIVLIMTVAVALLWINDYRKTNSRDMPLRGFVCDKKTTPSLQGLTVHELGRLTTMDGEIVDKNILLGKPVVLVFMFNVCGLECPAYERWRFYEKLNEELNNGLQIIACVVDEAPEGLDSYFGPDDVVIKGKGLAESLGLPGSTDLFFSSGGVFVQSTYIDWYSWQEARALARSIVADGVRTDEEPLLSQRIWNRNGAETTLGQAVADTGVSLVFMSDKDCGPCSVIYGTMEYIEKRFGDRVSIALLSPCRGESYREDVEGYYRYIGLPIHASHLGRLHDAQDLQGEISELAAYFDTKTNVPVFFHEIQLMCELETTEVPGVVVFKDGAISEQQFSCGSGQSEDGFEPLLLEIERLLSCE